MLIKFLQFFQLWRKDIQYMQVTYELWSYLQMLFKPSFVEEALSTEMTGPLRGREVIRCNPETRQTHLDLMFPTPDPRLKSLITMETLEPCRQLKKFKSVGYWINRACRMNGDECGLNFTHWDECGLNFTHSSEWGWIISSSYPFIYIYAHLSEFVRSDDQIKNIKKCLLRNSNLL